VKKFSHTRFEPWGYTKNPDIPVAKSLVDYLFRWLGNEFIPGFREANRPGGAHGHISGGEEAAGGDAESERSPAATKASGLANGQGKPHSATSTPTNGAAQGTPPAASTAKAASKAAASKRLEQAGVMVLEPGSNLGDRQSQFAKFQIDAPVCDGCGAITVRNGNCYLCHNCGNSMGCS
jgi:ribonucleoside-diphosphate reductase alpha chain